jgi:hypothetical protein
MNLTSVTYLGVLGSVGLSTVLSVVMLRPTRSVLRSFCPADDAVAFWTRFITFMFFLGPLLVTLIFGVPNSAFSSNLSATDLVTRVTSATLFGAFLTLGGMGLRVGTLRRTVIVAPPTKKTDDEFFR